MKVLQNYMHHFLFIVGINLFFLGLIFIVQQKNSLSFKASPIVITTSQVRLSPPTNITIPQHGIKTHIKPAEITNGTWQTHDTTASFLTTSMRPGEGGNIVIYGHNSKNIFKTLDHVKKDDVIEVQTENGKTYTYEVTRINTVDPSYIENIMPTNHEILTIYTCTGFLDSKRFVVQAKPIAVSSTE